MIRRTINLSLSDVGEVIYNTKRMIHITKEFIGYFYPKPKVRRKKR